MAKSDDKKVWQQIGHMRYVRADSTNELKMGLDDGSPLGTVPSMQSPAKSDLDTRCTSDGKEGSTSIRWIPYNQCGEKRSLHICKGNLWDLGKTKLYG